MQSSIRVIREPRSLQKSLHRWLYFEVSFRSSDSRDGWVKLMLRTVLFVILGISAGFAFATFLGGGAESIPGFSAGDLDARSEGDPADEIRPLTQRLSQLEAALTEEISKRESLQVQLAAVTEQMTSLQADDDGRETQGDRDQGTDSNIDRAQIQERFASRFGNRGNNDPDRRLNQLIEAGFSPDQAQHLTERESELRLDALYAQYDAVREGEPFDPRTDRFDPQDQLRQELGDASYERYLEATGQSTSVGVRQVMEGSAGQVAGLQTGDELIAYGGQRVFDTGDLNELILDGTPGQTVVVDVLREGQQIQVYMPRGPIGITGGRGGR